MLRVLALSRYRTDPSSGRYAPTFSLSVLEKNPEGERLLDHELRQPDTDRRARSGQDRTPYDIHNDHFRRPAFQCRQICQIISRIAHEPERRAVKRRHLHGLSLQPKAAREKHNADNIHQVKPNRDRPIGRPPHHIAQLRAIKRLRHPRQPNHVDDEKRDDRKAVANEEGREGECVCHGVDTGGEGKGCLYGEYTVCSFS